MLNDGRMLHVVMMLDLEEGWQHFERINGIFLGK
jgi:hypothetical protein